MALKQGDIQNLVKIIATRLKNFNINHRNDNDLAAIHIAIDKNEKDTVADLLQLGADIELKHNHEPPLYQAAKLGHAAIVKLLIKYKAEINKQKEGYGEEKGFTALHIAIREGDLKVVEILLKRNADVTIKR